jgi:hypothetical protein
MKIRYLEAGKPYGVLTIDGVDYTGPIPPNDGWVRAKYEAQLATAELVPIPVPVAPLKQWTPLEFMEKFTPAERKAIRALAKQNDDIEDWLDLLRASTAVLPSDQRTQAGLAAMVQLGAISQARATEILAS